MNNPLAFPRSRGQGGGEYNSGQEGMTLLDYFAAKAMQAMVTEKMDGNLMPSIAYNIAEAMLKEREKRCQK